MSGLDEIDLYDEAAGTHHGGYGGDTMDNLYEDLAREDEEEHGNDAQEDIDLYGDLDVRKKPAKSKEKAIPDTTKATGTRIAPAAPAEEGSIPLVTAARPGRVATSASAAGATAGGAQISAAPSSPGPHSAVTTAGSKLSGGAFTRAIGGGTGPGKAANTVYIGNLNWWTTDEVRNEWGGEMPLLFAWCDTSAYIYARLNGKSTCLLGGSIHLHSF